MATVTKTKTWADNEVVNYTDINSNFDTLYNVVNGNLDTDNVDTTVIATVGTTQTITGAKTYTGAQAFSDTRVGTIYDAGNSGTSKEIDWVNGETQKLTLTGNVTLTFTNVTAGAYLTLWLVQDGTGSRTVTWPSGTAHQFGSAPVLTTTASAIDLVGIRAYTTSAYHTVGVTYNIS